MNAPSVLSLSLDHLPMRCSATVIAVNWEEMSETEGRRLRALGLDTGAMVEKRHKGMFGLNDPVALKVGRMLVAVRQAHARAIMVSPTS